MRHNHRWSRAVIGAALVGLLAAPPLLAQATGTVTGKVTAADSPTPVEAARVQIVGTPFQVLSNREGVYTLRNVPAGQVTIRVSALGFASATKDLAVAAGQTATLDFTLTQAPYTLEEITTTAIGDTRKAELGNSVNTIQVAKLAEEAPVKTLADILKARAPGVQVFSSTGTIGGGQRIRIRGSNSVSLSNEPLYIVDGVRIESSNGSNSFGVGGQSPSRVNDINPDEIADIQVLKGPSASAIYGTQGSNGVILITTKRGVAGRARWNLWSEQGINQDKNDYRDNYYGAAGTDPNSGRCTLVNQAAGSCTVTTIYSFNPLKDPVESPLATGRRQQYGASVSGGSDLVQYFLSAERESEKGVFFMPDAEQARILDGSGRTALRDDELNPNNIDKVNLRSNLSVVLSPKANVAVNLGYVTSGLRLPQNDNNVRGIHSSAVNGDGRGPLIDLTLPNGQVVNRAWGFHRPGETFQRLTKQTVQRFTTGATANYSPNNWLTSRAVVGLDLTSRIDQLLNRFDEGPFFSLDREGIAAEGRRTIAVYTIDANATAAFDLMDNLTSKTTAGINYVQNNFRGTNAQGDPLPPGAVTVTAGSNKQASETNNLVKTAGGFVQQTFGLDDKLFLTGAVRVDRNSASGTLAKTIVYPKASISYLISESGFFPKGSFLNSFRLRASYGHAGQQPNGSQALESYSATAAAVGGTVQPAVTINNLGDPNLKPERSIEYEAGFDANFLNSRVALEVTAFHKDTKDALIFVPTPLSAGNPSGQFRNLGKVRNEGIEYILNTQVLTGKSLGWDLTLSGSFLKNRLLDLGGQPPINANGVTQQHREGFPLGGYWARPYTYNDANGDGIIAASEITPGDSLEYLGNSQPTRELAISSQWNLFDGKLQIATQLDYRGGAYLYNLEEDFRCRSSQNCQALYDINAPMDQKARVTALRFLGSNNTNFGFIDPADYFKWRELSVTFNAPKKWAQAFTAERLSITASGRNLAMWTKYTGVDPEVNGQGESNFAQRDFLSLPPLRSFSLRLNLSF
ncbi:MAG: SusC/RagA family TonB-linked outer membrane protein [Gemmatimonadales bacterium]